MNDVVVLAYLHSNKTSHSFSESKERLVAHDLVHAGHVIRAGGPFVFRCGSGGLIEARNDVARRFLDKHDADWLFMVDSDMGFAADTVDRLLGAAHPTERPVVGGLCFALREVAEDGMGGWRTSPYPTIYNWAKKPNGEFGFHVRREYPVNTLVQVAGTGAACLLVHRSALQKVREQHGDAWFDRVVYADGTKVAEDLSFCYRLGTVGMPIFVHTGVRTTHHKEIWLSEADYWEQRLAPPATERTAVIVPVMERPQNAEPFMATLRASTGMATVYALANEDDKPTIDAWREAGAEVVTSTGTTFAEKANHGYRSTTEPWIFLTGDDVAFWPAWLDHAQATAKVHTASVVGTNDLANPRVMNGEHATHMLIRRSYIDEQGASWDGPGVVCHEGYRHWYVDDEIVTAAKQRGAWAMALASKVEHNHPLFGKGENDAIYELGQSHADFDRKLFKGRLKAYATQET